MRTRRRTIGVLALAAVIAGAACLPLLRDRYRPAVEAELRGELRQVNFRPHIDREWVNVTDPAVLGTIRAAVSGARGMSVASLPPASCNLQFVFADGRVVYMMVSPTGMTDRNVLGEDAASFKPLGYVTLEWNGYHRVTEAQPFMDELRRQNRVAATQSVGAAGAR
jgi:hypothetical protein